MEEKRNSSKREKRTTNYQIANLRNRLHLTGEQFAERLTEYTGEKYTRSDVNNWESDYRIKDRDLINICKCFNVSADSLLFDGPNKYLSNDQNTINAANHTGLSQKAISVLHELHDLGFDLNSLSFLLEKTTFYRTVLGSLGAALRYLEKPDAEIFDLSEEELAIAEQISNKGFLISEPHSAFSIVVHEAAGMLEQMIRSIKEYENIPALKKLYAGDDERFMEALKIEQDLKQEVNDNGVDKTDDN